MRRAAAAQGIRYTPNYSDARIGYFTENGKRHSELVLVKSPDKLLLRDDYPWLHFVVYRGYDGKRAWTSSNFGGGGLADPRSARLLKSTLAWYLSADMVPSRWSVKAVRLPDRVIAGHSYYAIEEVPRDGNPSYAFFDKRTFQSAAVSTGGDRYFLCVKRGGSECLRQENIVAEHVTGYIDIEPLQIKLDDSQFEMPSMLEDSTTPKLLAGYRTALGDTVQSSRTLRGIWQLPAQHVAPWTLGLAPPSTFAASFSNIWGVAFFRIQFDGSKGTISDKNGPREAPYVAAIYGMAYNHCELNALACGVRVTRLANIGADGRSFYAIGITSKRKPYLWYTVLLDSRTGLPYAYWLRDTLLYVSDYAKSAWAERIPATWTYESVHAEIRITGVKEVQVPVREVSPSSQLPPY